MNAYDRKGNAIPYAPRQRPPSGLIDLYHKQGWEPVRPAPEMEFYLVGAQSGPAKKIGTDDAGVPVRRRRAARQAYSMTAGGRIRPRDRRHL